MITEQEEKAMKKWIESIYPELSHEHQMEAEAFFPELKESRGEKIRKWLICTLKSLNNSPVHIDGAYEMMLPAIAWLEKQGNPKSYPWKPTKEQFEALDYAYNSCSDTERGNYYEGVLETLIEDLHKLEKYGEQETFCDECRKEHPTHSCQDITELGRYALEKQDEFIRIKKGKNYLCTKTHKYAGLEWIEGVKYYSPEDYSLVNQGCTCYCPKYSKEEHNNFFKEVEYDGCLEADKVEPKFKVGDWVVYYRNDSSREILHVFDIRDGRYYFNDNIHFSWSVKECDEKCHLWTIQDAKEGDVLYCKKDDDIEIIIMYLGINIHNNVDSYCRYNSKLGFNTYITNVLDAEHDFITPATKEQRDILEKAMTDARYTFDFEKKELKKIEQDSTEFGENRSKELSLSLQIQSYLNTASDELYAKGKPLYSEERLKEIHECMSMWAKLHHAYFYQKPAWSEEDEKFFKTALWHISYSISNGESHDTHCDTTEWFKSLKDRVQPQPNQEWSEEDEKNWQGIWDEIWANKYDAKEYEWDTYDRFLNWLKSLRPQKQWRPSEEQMDALADALSLAKNCGEGSAFGLRTLHEQLKKL